MLTSYRTALLACVLLAGFSAQVAEAKPWYKDWKVYVGAGIIVGANIADARTTCQHAGYAEQRFGRGCATAIGISTSASIMQVGLWRLGHHVDRDETSKPIIFLRDWAIPAAIGIEAGHAAYHNAGLPPISQPVGRSTSGIILKPSIPGEPSF